MNINKSGHGFGTSVCLRFCCVHERDFSGLSVSVFGLKGAHDERRSMIFLVETVIGPAVRFRHEWRPSQSWDGLEDPWRTSFVKRTAEEVFQMMGSEEATVPDINGIVDSTEIGQNLKRPTAQSKPRQCTYYIERKKRPCRVWTLRHGDYCAEHAVTENQLSGEYTRIKCPYDPSHTCYEKLLKQHLKKCNMRPKAREDYFQEGINSDRNALTSEEPLPSLGELSVQELKEVINIVSTLHKDVVPLIREKFGLHPALGSEMLRTDIGDSVMKHLVQNASLLNLLEENGLFQDSTCFIEIGAGKGALTFWVASTCKNVQCQFVLLDRSSHRHKRDNKLKDSGLDIKRIRIDIEHLKLDKLPSVEQTSHVVGITKHLCGGATDMALKCLLESNDAVSKVSGLALATCCHHRCTWSTYVAKTQLEDWGLPRKFFKVLTGMAGWAVCGTGRTKFEDAANEETEVISNPKYAELNLSIAERRKLGLQVKEILDYGRAVYIKSFGLNSSLYHYVDTATTLENVAIVATATER